MPKKGNKKERKPLGDPSDPQGFAVMAEEFFTSMQVTNYAEATIRNRYVYRRLMGQTKKDSQLVQF
jgi:hypothetical protein